MTLDNTIQDLKEKYSIIDTIDLNECLSVPSYKLSLWFDKLLGKVYRPVYENHERILFTLSQGDIYHNLDSKYGIVLEELSRWLNKIDISNYFVILLTCDQTVKDSYELSADELSTDPVPIEIIVYDTEITEKQIMKSSNKYDYNSTDPIKVSISDLSEKEAFLLTKSKTFCMYPWIHLHAYPTGEAHVCCQAEMDYPVGSLRTHTIKEIWNQDAMRETRRNMLEGKSVKSCNRCYEQENAGFFSGRQSANKHHGHLISRIHETQPDGTLDKFQLTYWDIRFSNLCNLQCRSCGHIFSSSWYQDQVKLAGPEWKKNHKPLFYAGRYETDAWEQLVEHIDYVEQIYFAGGEPLMMDEHYRILEELERRGRFDVRLIYNTNFTHTKLKDRYVFDYWRKFDSVAVGASLDAMGPRAEYIRKGTDWDIVERNRMKMLETCPDVDFYVSPTLSIMNAWHLPDFHKNWVERGFIKAQDLNVNILQDPPHYRIDIAPARYKESLQARYRDHIEWLRPQDPLNRATVGFESAMKFMMSTDNTYLLPRFWEKTNQLDGIRNERLLDIIPELKELDADPT